VKRVIRVTCYFAEISSWLRVRYLSSDFFVFFSKILLTFRDYFLQALSFFFFFFLERGKVFLDFRFLEFQITRGVISEGVSPISIRSNIDRKTLRVLREWIQCTADVSRTSTCPRDVEQVKWLFGESVCICLQLIIEAAQYDVTWLFIAEFKWIIYRILLNRGAVTAISCEMLAALEKDRLNYSSNEGAIDSANSCAKLFLQRAKIQVARAILARCKMAATFHRVQRVFDSSKSKH